MRQLRSFGHIRELIGSARGFVDSADEKRGPCDMVNALDRLVNAVAALADRIERAEAEAKEAEHASRLAAVEDEVNTAAHRASFFETFIVDHVVQVCDQLERLGATLIANNLDPPYDLGRFGPCPQDTFKRIMANAEAEFARIQSDPAEVARYGLEPGGKAGFFLKTED